MKKIQTLLKFISTTLILFATCPSISAPEQETFDVDRELFPFKSHYMQLENGARIHYIDEGKGSTLLLLHGNPTWSFLYRDIIADLKSEFRLIAPDYPGFGLSTAPEHFSFTAEEQAQAMNEFVQQLDLQDTIIMVQDWGGPIGFNIAFNNPDRITGFVIGNTWAWPLERRGHKIFSALMGGWSGKFMSWCCNGVVRFFMSKGVTSKLSKDELAMYLAPFNARTNRRQTQIFPAQLRDAKPFLSNVYENLENLSARPALLVWGTEDFAFKAPERNRFESIFSDHKTLLLENAGHFIQEDAPHEIAAAIRSWHKQHHQE